MNKLTVISEIGINHGGDLQRARFQIAESKVAGCQIAKFQYYDPIKVLGKDSPYLAEATQCQFTKAQHELLASACEKVGIEYLVSVFDLKDLAWANSLCRRIKIATRMNADIEFYEAALKTGLPILLSTQVPYKSSSPLITYLYCIPQYPTKLTQIDRAMLSWCEGLSTHCPSIAPALLAVAHNCTVIEAHTTLDRRMAGCDQKSSWTYSEMRTFVSTARDMGRIS